MLVMSSVVNCDFHSRLKFRNIKKAFVYFHITIKASESFPVKTAVQCICEQLLLKPELPLPKVVLLPSLCLCVVAEVKIFAREVVDEV